MTELGMSGTASETLFQRLVTEKVTVKELELSEREIFNTALQALYANRGLAKALDVTDEDERHLIVAWLKDTKNTYNTHGHLKSLTVQEKLALLNQSILTSEGRHSNELLKEYLALVLSNAADFNIYRSFTDEPVFGICYESKKGEEVIYRDKELDVPIYMLVKLHVSFKVTDPYYFVKFMDVNLRQLNEKFVLSKLFPMISTLLRGSALKIIKENGISYYDLTQYYGAIAADLKKELEVALANAGVEVGDVHLDYTSVSNGADKLFEEQRIEFMQREKQLALQHQAEVMSLENYERKAEIHSKYPDYEVGLTEKEKDNAIDRYLIRESGSRAEEIVRPEQEALRARVVGPGAVAKLAEVSAERIEFKEPKAVPWLGLGITLGVILFVVGIIVTAETIKVGSLGGWSLMSVGVLLAGSGIALLVNKKNEAELAALARAAAKARAQDSDIEEEMEK